MSLPLFNIEVRNTGSRSGKSDSEGEPSEVISTLTPALSRQREREIWCIFPAMGRIRRDAIVTGD
jgi:hypothetical protein